MTTLSPTQIGRYAYQAGLPAAYVPVAVAVAIAESGGDPNDDNGLAAGLWQINYKAHPQWTAAQLKDPLTNAKAMVSISKAGKDFSAWSTYPTSVSRGIGSTSGIARFNAALLMTKAMNWGAALTGTTPGVPYPGTGIGADGTFPTDQTGAAAVTGDVASSIAGAAKAFTAVPAAITATNKWLADRHNQLRLAWGLGGAVLLTGGVLMFAGEGVLGGVTKVLKPLLGASPTGKIAAVAKKVGSSA